jgi:Tol biopolymer transport system component
VSSYAAVHGVVTFSPSGQEVVWSVVDPARRASALLRMVVRDGRWGPPESPAFSSTSSDDVPFFSPDGSRLFFLSDRPSQEGTGRSKENIWYVERAGEGWSEASLLDTPANEMDLHWQFSLSRDGTLFFASSDGRGMGLNDIWRSALVDGVYQEPENLGPAINSPHPDFAPFIAPDESFLIFTSVDRPEGSGGSDLYVSFRDLGGSWTEAVNLGEPVNSPGGELLASRSPDGRYLFFTGMRDGRKGTFWVEARVVEDLRSRILGDSGIHP